jgi:hypothetical protein
MTSIRRFPVITALKIFVEMPHHDNGVTPNNNRNVEQLSNWANRAVCLQWSNSLLFVNSYGRWKLGRPSVGIPSCVVTVKRDPLNCFTFLCSLTPRMLSLCSCYKNGPSELTFSSLAVSLRTTRFNIKKFYVVPTLRLCVLYGSQNKQQLLP